MVNLSWLLGTEFKSENDFIKLEQNKMMNCQSKAMSYGADFYKIKDEDSTKLTDPKYYEEIVCSLIYCYYFEYSNC